MKISNQAILLSLLALGLGACSEDNPWGTQRGKGGIDLKLSASADVKDAIPVLRSGAPELMAPDAADFAISLRDMDTDQVLTWPTLEDFNAEGSFDVGIYTLTASYGSMSECGFDKPCFQGEATVNVFEGRETQVDVTARLANTMLSVDYTDAFREYFLDYSVTAHTEGEANVVFASSETRAAYMAPGDVILDLMMINPSGQTARVSAASFPAAAAHHYHVTFDVNADATGNSVVQVIFDDSLTQENVTISLTDELFTSEGPVLSPEGFEDGATVEVLSGNMSETPLKFKTICKSGIKSAVLTIAGDHALPFGKEVELVDASEALQAQLEQAEIKVAGIFKNPAEMAVVDVTSLSRHLPAGTYQVTLRVTDKLDRVSEPVTLALSTRQIVLDVLSGSAIYSYPGSAVTQDRTVDATVSVSYNGINPATNISFQNKCRTGVYKDCEIVSVEESTRTRAFEEKTYLFHIRVCDAETSPLPMKVLFNGEQWGDDFTIDVVEPVFTLEADTYATYAKFRINAEDPAQTATIANGLKLYWNGQQVVSERLKVDAEKGIITMINLASDKDHQMAYTLTDKGPGVYDKEFSIHTEAQTAIPNRSFADITETINQDIQVGGQYKCGAIDYTNWVNVKVEEPKSWATVNAKTFYSGARTVNSWFTVVSTYMDNGVAVLRSVAYDYDGTVPSKTGSFMSATHYNTNVPSAFASKAAGELFLGTYSFDGTNEVRNARVEFSSRPSSLTFDYTYEAYEADKGYAVIEVFDENGSVIGSASVDLESTTGRQSVSVPVTNYQFGKKAAYVGVGFKSSKGDFNYSIPDPSVDSWSGFLPATSYKHWFGQNQYHTFASGSVLKIENVKLNY